MKKTVFISLLAITALLLPSCADNVGENADTLPSDEQTVQTQISTEKNETAAETKAIQTATVIPDESYIGVWSTDENRTDEILIYEITSDAVKFNTGVFKSFGFTAAAIIKDGELAFGDGISPDYSGPKGLMGRLRFGENSVTVIYDSFGTFEYLEDGPNEYVFTIKAADSDRIVEEFKAVE